MNGPRLTSPWEVIEPLSFARRAERHFKSHPSHWTYTDGDMLPGCLFGVRWGVDPAAVHAVLVFRVASDFQPTIYGDLDHDRSGQEILVPISSTSIKVED